MRSSSERGCANSCRVPRQIRRPRAARGVTRNDARRMTLRKISRLGHEARLGWSLVAPALSVIALIAIFPLGWTFWESLHLHELRMPWLRQSFVGLANYVEIAKDPRFWAALGHTAFFTVVSISLELLIGLFLALAMNRVFRGRGFVRAAVLVPWAIPTVVAALL